MEELLVDQGRVLGREHPDTLTIRGSLAYLRGEAGDVVGAVAALEELLADLRQVLGRDHPDTLATRRNLAHWQDRLPENGQS
ncbi:tetratricopeptide repeat protein [Kutzneria albida]|uniref:tetratricopeptide repeat protein n=1 Tax=Kutzneria albida TaxID=43357 RepID=UPI00191C2313|nr:tetratricopeptide repeat protein [Kutzneria albida]